MTYEEALYVAGLCVALADTLDGKDRAIDLCLAAGYMRGLIDAGEPVGSIAYEDAVAAMGRCLVRTQPTREMEVA